MARECLHRDYPVKIKPLCSGQRLEKLYYVVAEAFTRGLLPTLMAIGIPAGHIGDPQHCTSTDWRLQWPFSPMGVYLDNSIIGSLLQIQIDVGRGQRISPRELFHYGFEYQLLFSIRLRFHKKLFDFSIE